MFLQERDWPKACSESRHSKMLNLILTVSYLVPFSARTHKFGRQSAADDDGYDYGASGYDSYWKSIASGGAADQEDDEEDYEEDYEDDEEEDDDEDDDDEAEAVDTLKNLSLGVSSASEDK